MRGSSASVTMPGIPRRPAVMMSALAFETGQRQRYDVAKRVIVPG